MQKIDLVQGNVRKLPFEDNYFDTVSVSNSLHHFDHPVKAIQSMLRVLVPGGLLVINEMINEHLNPAQQAQFEYHSLKAEVDTLAGRYHRKIYTKYEQRAQTIKEMIETNGFQKPPQIGILAYKD